MWSRVVPLLVLLALTSYLQPGSAQIDDTDVEYNTYYSFSDKEQKLYRPGSATETNSCQHVRQVPAELRKGENIYPKGLDNFYQKYTEAYGIPVVSSINVPDDALRRACYTTRFLFASHSVVREWYYRLSGRIAVIGKDEGTTDIPEHSELDDWYNQRARGLGATHDGRVCSAGEENVFCYAVDRYRREDILLHETAHGVHLLGAAVGIVGWDMRLKAAYDHAKSTGLFNNTYSMTNKQEYFAENTQAYFNVQSYAPKPDGNLGPINTREKLRDYDPDLYNLIQEIFPCNNTYLKRCESYRTLEDQQQLLMNCEKKATVVSTSDCKDENPWCELWSTGGECTANPGYMKSTCQRNCNMCQVKAIGDSKADPDCVDEETDCAHWAGTGECQANPGYMLSKCKYSCDQC